MNNREWGSVIAHVYETYDYDIFERMEFNRDVERKRKDDLIKSFKEKDILNPIICTPTKNDKLIVVEGQGRYEARKEMGLPIRFIVEHGLTVDDCMLLNKYNKSWTSKMFIKSYADQGNENYKRLEQLCDRTKVPTTTVVSLLIGSASHATETLKTSSFIFTEEDAAWCEDVIDTTKNIFELCGIDGKITQTFYRAVAIMMTHPDYNETTMYRQCEKVVKGKIFRSIPDNLIWLSDVYNKGKKKKRVHFEDAMGASKGSMVRDYSKTKRSRQTDVSTLKKSAVMPET